MLRISNFQDSQLPSGEWVSGADTAARVRGEISRPYSEGFGYGGTESSPGVFDFPTDSMPAPATTDQYFAKPFPTPTHPDYGTPAVSGGSRPAQQYAPVKARSSRPSGGYGGQVASGSVQADTGPMPTYAAGTFEAPEYDESKIDVGQQRLASPGLRRLRQQMTVVGAQTYENPNVKAMTLREALQGYGSGVESIMSGARARAANEYNQRYKTELDTKMANFRAAEEAKNRNFTAALAAWSKGKSTSGSATPTGTTARIGQTAGGYSTNNIGTPSGRQI